MRTRCVRLWRGAVRRRRDPIQRSQHPATNSDTLAPPAGRHGAMHCRLQPAPITGVGGTSVPMCPVEGDLEKSQVYANIRRIDCHFRTGCRSMPENLASLMVSPKCGRATRPYILRSSALIGAPADYPQSHVRIEQAGAWFAGSWARVSFRLKLKPPRSMAAARSNALWHACQPVASCLCIPFVEIFYRWFGGHYVGLHLAEFREMNHNMILAKCPDGYT